MKPKPILVALMLGLSTLLISACGAETTGQSAQQTAWHAIHEGALLVDVRTSEEYSTGHLEGALLIPYDQVANRISEFGSDKDRTIVLYCRSGKRADKAEQVLGQHGFTHIINGGGYQDMLATKSH